MPSVAVVIVVRGREILTGYNPKWKRFTLPMTKLRQVTRETWVEAATRAAEEWIPPAEVAVSPPRRIGELDAVSRRSGRDNRTTDYRFSIWTMSVSRRVRPEDQQSPEARWSTMGQIANAHAQSVSWTAKAILNRIAAIAAGMEMELIPYLSEGGWRGARDI